MSARSKDARAAMSAIVRAGSAARWNGTGVGDGVTFSFPAPEDVVRFATTVADAMAAERAKRVPAAAPDTITDKDGTRLTFTPIGDGKVRVHATDHATDHATEVEKARREGRDAGLREAVDWLADNGYGGAGMALARFSALVSK